MNTKKPTHYLQTLLMAAACAGPLAACGGDDSSGSSVDGSTNDSQGGDDPCGFASQRYLPYEPGLHWTYQITEISSGQKTAKDQVLTAMTDPDFGDGILQTTGKINGETKSFVKVEGDRVGRYWQDDIDSQGMLEERTIYTPPQIRIDETAARLEQDATWEESYTETTEDAAGTVTGEVPTTDQWTVLDTAAACESPLGTFSCLRLRRVRTQGGIAEKEFWFAKGIGKIKESGANQVEELMACGK